MITYSLNYNFVSFIVLDQEALHFDRINALKFELTRTANNRYIICMKYCYYLYYNNNLLFNGMNDYEVNILHC